MSVWISKCMTDIHKSVMLPYLKDGVFDRPGVSVFINDRPGNVFSDDWRRNPVVLFISCYKLRHSRLKFPVQLIPKPHFYLEWKRILYVSFYKNLLTIYLIIKLLLKDVWTHMYSFLTSETVTNPFPKWDKTKSRQLLIL